VDDEICTRWTADIERILDETTFLFWSRKYYRTVAKMFDLNEELRECGSDAWTWIKGMYGREAAMAVRREVDDQPNAITLVNLLYDIEKNAHLLTRERHERRYGDLLHWMRSDIDAAFVKLGGAPPPGSPTDSIPPSTIAKDREALQAATKATRLYAHRELAHRQRNEQQLTLPFNELDAAVAALFTCLRKYYGILKGAGLLGATPVHQFDWIKPFTIPWVRDDSFEPPRDQWDP
jgi:hypothetical protein